MSAGNGSDPTYELACLKRANEKSESLRNFIENSRNMFLLQVSKTADGSTLRSRSSQFE